VILGSLKNFVGDRDHSIIDCLHHIYMGVIPLVHLVRAEPHIQRNANREVAKIGYQ